MYKLKCLWCQKEIEDTDKAIIIGMDGDFVCSEECKAEFFKEAERINNMTDDEFESWLLAAASMSDLEKEDDT